MTRSMDETKDVSHGASLPADNMPAILSLVGFSADAAETSAETASIKPANTVHNFLILLLPCYWTTLKEIGGSQHPHAEMRAKRASRAAARPPQHEASKHDPGTAVFPLATLGARSGKVDTGFPSDRAPT